MKNVYIKKKKGGQYNMKMRNSIPEDYIYKIVYINFTRQINK